MSLEEFIKRQDAEKLQREAEAERESNLRELEAERKTQLAIAKQTPMLVELIELFKQQDVRPVTLWRRERDTRLHPQDSHWDIVTYTAIDVVWPCSYEWDDLDEWRSPIGLSQCVNQKGNVYNASYNDLEPQGPMKGRFGTHIGQGTVYHLVSPGGSLHVHEKVREKIPVLSTTSVTPTVWVSHNIDDQNEQARVSESKFRTWEAPVTGPSDMELLAMVYRRVVDDFERKRLQELWSG